MIVDVSKSSVILSSAPVIKLLKSKEASGVIDIKVKMSLLNKQYIYSLLQSLEHDGFPIKIYNLEIDFIVVAINSWYWRLN